MSVYKKLNAVRLQLHAMTLKKSGYNSFGKWHYFELADFLVPALKLFEDNGLCGVVSSDAGTMTLAVRECDGDGCINFAIPLSTAQLKGSHEVQNLGAVITYSRRYLWTLALEILEHDAVDAAEPARPEGLRTPAAESAAIHAVIGMDEAELSDIERIAKVINAKSAGNPTEASRMFYDDGLENDVQTAVWAKLKPETKKLISRKAA